MVTAYTALVEPDGSLVSECPEGYSLLWHRLRAPEIWPAWLVDLHFGPAAWDVELQVRAFKKERQRTQ